MKFRNEQGQLMELKGGAEERKYKKVGSGVLNGKNYTIFQHPEYDNVIVFQEHGSRKEVKWLQVSSVNSVPVPEKVETNEDQLLSITSNSAMPIGV